MRIAALDLAATTGVAIGEPGGVPIWWTESLGDPMHRGAALMRVVSTLIKTHGADEIVIEAPLMVRGPNSSTKTLRSLVGLAEVALAAARYLRAPAHEAEVATVRRHFVGYAPKRDEAKRVVVARCRALGWDVRDHNAADACALWDYRCAQVSIRHSVETAALFAAAREAAR